MRSIPRLIYLLVLFLFAPLCVNATDHYVDKNAAGQSNGTSWVNAWQSFSAINWGSINPGDYVYISGGADSIVYSESLQPACSGTASNYVTIIAGKYSPSPSGHSGRVVISGSNHTRDGIAFYDQGGNKPSYLIIKGLETREVEVGVFANFNNVHNCLVLDSLGLYGFKEGGVRFETGETGYQNMDSLFIQNCTIISPDYIDGETDGVQLKGVSHIFIDNNYIRIPNQQPLQHVDGIQAYLSNGGIITNNIIICDSVNSQEGGGCAIIYGSEYNGSPEGNLPIIYYNNFMYMGGVWYPPGNDGGVFWPRWYDNGTMNPSWAIHNTIIANGPKQRCMVMEINTTMINNIIAQYSVDRGDELATLEENLSGSSILVDSTRNNLFYRNWESDVDFSGSFTGSGGSPTGEPSGWTAWTTTYGGTGVKGDPDLISNIGHEPDQGALVPDIGGNSAGLNQGEDVEDLLNWLNTTYGLNGRLTWTDINGNARDNTPDIGAYEYVNGSDTTFPLYVSIADNWNLVSVPGINPNGMEVDTWWQGRDKSSEVFKLNGNYTAVSATSPGEGYWMKHLGARTYNTGDEWPRGGIQIVAHDPIAGAPGWNTIGGYEFECFKQRT